MDSAATMDDRPTYGNVTSNAVVENIDLALGSSPTPTFGDGEFRTSEISLSDPSIISVVSSSYELANDVHISDSSNYELASEFEVGDAIAQEILEIDETDMNADAEVNKILKKTFDSHSMPGHSKNNLESSQADIKTVNTNTSVDNVISNIPLGNDDISSEPTTNAMNMILERIAQIGLQEYRCRSPSEATDVSSLSSVSTPESDVNFFDTLQGNSDQNIPATGKKFSKSNEEWDHSSKELSESSVDDAINGANAMSSKTGSTEDKDEHIAVKYTEMPIEFSETIYPFNALHDGTQAQPSAFVTVMPPVQGQHTMTQYEQIPLITQQNYQIPCNGTYVACAYDDGSIRYVPVTYPVYEGASTYEHIYPANDASHIPSVVAENVAPQPPTSAFPVYAQEPECNPHFTDYVVLPPAQNYVPQVGDGVNIQGNIYSVPQNQLSCGVNSDTTMVTNSCVWADSGSQADDERGFHTWNGASSDGSTEISYNNEGCHGYDDSGSATKLYNYPTVYVSEAGLITVLLKNDMSVELTVDKTIRVVSHQKSLVAATNSRGSASCIHHPGAKIVQDGTTTDVSLFLGRRAKMTTENITFSDTNRCYTFDQNDIESTKCEFSDITKDNSVNLLFSSSPNVMDLMQKCSEIAKTAQYIHYEDGGFIVRINGMKITQTATGDVTVSCGPKFIKMSPYHSIVRVETHFVLMSVEMNWTVRVTRGTHTLFADQLSFILSNGKLEAGFGRDNQLRVVTLPERYPLQFIDGIHNRRKDRRPRSVGEKTKANDSVHT